MEKNTDLQINRHMTLCEQMIFFKYKQNADLEKHSIPKAYFVHSREAIQGRSSSIYKQNAFTVLSPFTLMSSSFWQ